MGQMQYSYVTREGGSFYRIQNFTGRIWEFRATTLPYEDGNWKNYYFWHEINLVPESEILAQGIEIE